MYYDMMSLAWIFAMNNYNEKGMKQDCSKEIQNEKDVFNDIYRNGSTK